MAEFATDNVVLLGDFNLVPDSGIDRLTAAGSLHLGLAAWGTPMVLRMIGGGGTRSPYTCHSSSCNTFSHIDLAFAGRSVLPGVRDIRILPRNILDHAQLLEP